MIPTSLQACMRIQNKIHIYVEVHILSNFNLHQHVCTYVVAIVILVIQEKHNENQELFTNVVGFKEAIVSCKK